VTHAEVRECLRAYADGTLDDAAAEVVRAHLASGCAECLRAAFTRPVGVPRAPVVVRRLSPGMIAAAVLAGAVIGGASVGLLLGMTRERPRTGDAAIEALVGRIERLRVERERAEASARERLARLEAQVGASERAVASPPPEPPATDDPVAEPATGPSWLEELLATAGARVVPLRPADSAPGASGYAVWSPARGVVVVSASDLPAGRSDAVYRVRVTLNGGATVWAGDLPASERGTLIVTASMPEGAGWRVTRVDLYRDPPNAPALTANLRP